MFVILYAFWILFVDEWLFQITDELAAMQSIKRTPGEADKKVGQTVNGLQLDWANLASVATGGAPGMVGSKKEVTAHRNPEMDKQNHSDPTAIQCLIHWQALWSKSLKWDCVMKIVVFCANFIRANALNHNFKNFCLR